MDPKNQPLKKLNGKTVEERDTTEEKNLEREGGDDSLTNASPEDSRADEKIIVNEQREDKITNAPSDQPL